MSLYFRDNAPINYAALEVQVILDFDGTGANTNTFTFKPSVNTNNMTPIFYMDQPGGTYYQPNIQAGGGYYYGSNMPMMNGKITVNVWSVGGQDAPALSTTIPMGCWPVPSRSLTAPTTARWPAK